ARHHPAPPKRLLVSCGATDPTNLTSLVLASLPARELEVTVALGSAAPHLDSVRSMVLDWSGPQRLELMTDVVEMAALMARADLAVGAAGSSCWECCCLGLPLVAVGAAPNQSDVVCLLQAEGAATVFSSPPSSRELEGALMRLLDDRELRQQRSERAAALVDGQGCARVSDRIEAWLAGSRGGRI
ncbi:MAG: UDP-2,4-diacetamido-2,4,6-trideoxy-beta-L-altropyranose hydrolase, partial [Candidatus Eremiobacteraeota bacterium]|nr:UDP-2,4-diacetamido-2,4,6-trideoxy-beta-L-altropyranose hydrolase [Candidatus Eremiobacteraeota bacterium]